MPLVDRPIIQYAVEEAIASGIEQIIIVIASGRSAIEDHFDANPTLERWLEERGDIAMLRAVRRITEVGPIAFVHQKEQLGLGHAVLMAKELVGDEPFAVLLSDDVMLNPGGTPVMRQLIEQHAAHRGSVVAVQRDQGAGKLDARARRLVGGARAGKQADRVLEGSTGALGLAARGGDEAVDGAGARPKQVRPHAGRELLNFLDRSAVGRLAERELGSEQELPGQRPIGPVRRRRLLQEAPGEVGGRYRIATIERDRKSVV